MPRFESRLTAPIALLALAAALSSCGGSDRMSKPDYEQTINDAGRKLSAVFGTVDQGTTTLNQLAVRVQRARRTLVSVTGQLEDVKPPKQAERPHRSLVVALKTLSTDLQRLAQAAASGYPKSVAEARARLSAPARQIVAAIQELQQSGFAINTG